MQTQKPLTILLVLKLEWRRRRQNKGPHLLTTDRGDDVAAQTTFLTHGFKETILSLARAQLKHRPFSFR